MESRQQAAQLSLFQEEEDNAIAGAERSASFNQQLRLHRTWPDGTPDWSYAFGKATRDELGTQVLRLTALR